QRTITVWFESHNRRWSASRSRRTSGSQIRPQLEELTMSRLWSWMTCSHSVTGSRKSRKARKTKLTAISLEGRIVPSTFASLDTSITINDAAPASPYPSTISVTGLSGQVITDLNVTIKGLTHTQVQDIDMLLVAPDGTNIVLMSDNGGTSGATGVTFTFD